MERIALLTAAFGAMILTAVSGFFIIPALHKLHFGQTIKEIGPTWHQGKNGTPTMGGLTFYLGCLLGVVLGYAALALSVPEVLGGWASQATVQLLVSLDETGPQLDEGEIVQIANADQLTKNLVVRVTDSRLLQATGGIVQGMSGCPILQDGKLAGAVTHVFTEDPTTGYGIFAQVMWEECQSCQGTG